MIFCAKCGKQYSENALFCPQCGEPNNQNARVNNVSHKSGIVALLLCFFFGMFGFHRFYVGKSGTGFIMFFLSIIGIGLIATLIWAFVDFIVIICQNFRDGNNKLIKF